VLWSSAGENAIQLAKESELPLEARLTFSLRAQSPAAFGPDERLEVATTDGTFSAVLGVATGEVMLESRKVAVVTLDPTKALGASAFGPLQFRRMVNGVAGAWTPLATLVRLPKLTGVNCPAEPGLACSLSGADLFLLDSVSVDAGFTRVTQVPDGFTEPVLRIPHPLQGKLYVKLRDDPEVVDVALLNVRTAASTEATPPAAERLPVQPPPAAPEAVAPPAATALKTLPVHAP